MADVERMEAIAAQSRAHLDAARTAEVGVPLGHEMASRHMPLAKPVVEDLREQGWVVLTRKEYAALVDELHAETEKSFWQGRTIARLERHVRAMQAALVSWYPMAEEGMEP